MPIVTINGPTIAAGATLSDAVDCTSGVPIMLIAPPAWTSGRIGFLISPDNTVFSGVYTREGEPVSMFIVPNGAIVIPEAIKTASWIKFQSSVAQAAQRVFKIIVNTSGI